MARMLPPFTPDDLLAAPDRPPLLVLGALAQADASSYQAGQVLALAAQHLPGADFRHLDLGLDMNSDADRLGIKKAPTILIWDRRGACELARLAGVADAGAIWGFLTSRLSCPG
jgi:hypothetical protein